MYAIQGSTHGTYSINTQFRMCIAHADLCLCCSLVAANVFLWLDLVMFAEDRCWMVAEE